MAAGGVRPPRQPKSKSTSRRQGSAAIQHMMVTTLAPDGTPMSGQQFMEMLFGKLPEFFKTRPNARPLSAPDPPANLTGWTRRKSFGSDKLADNAKIIDAKKGDLFACLAYVRYALPTSPRRRATPRRRLR